jgi:hypothetical protein
LNTITKEQAIALGDLLRLTNALPDTAACYRRQGIEQGGGVLLVPIPADTYVALQAARVAWSMATQARKEGRER